MGAGQHADFGDDRTDGFDVTAVDALAGVEDVVANDVRFQFLEHAGDAQLVVFRLLTFREEVVHDLLLHFADGRITILLDRDRVGLAQFGFADGAHVLVDGAVVHGRNLARLLRGLLGQFDDRLDDRLEMPMTEHHGAEHDVFVQFLGFRFHHQNGVGGAGDNEIEIGVSHLVERRVENVFVVDEADAGCTDRTLERRAGEGQRSRRSHQRQNVRIVFHVMRQHRHDDLGFVAPAVDEQRADRTVDQAGNQRFLFGGPAFAFEVAAGNAAGCVGLFLIVHGERQEIDTFARRLGGDDGGKHDGLAIGGDHGTIGLTRDLAGFEFEWTSTPVDLD